MQTATNPVLATGNTPAILFKHSLDAYGNPHCAFAFANRVCFNRILDADGSLRHAFDFADRDSYLSMRQQFRAFYRELSTNIRALKVEHKKLQRAGDFATDSAKLYQLRKLQTTATSAIACRQASKAQAQAQYLACKQKAGELIPAL